MVTRETRYHVSIAEHLKRDLMSHVVELFQRPRVILKKAGEVLFGTKESLLATFSTREATGVHLTGVLG